MFFFEPDSSRDVHKRVTESLISDSFVYTSNMENTRILQDGLHQKQVNLQQENRNLQQKTLEFGQEPLGIHQIRL